jgi:site-specific DNA-methyltransferase (adenine-specific)
MTLTVEKFDDGFALHGDATSDEVKDFVSDFQIPLIIADPPYGNIVNESWDKTTLTDVKFCDWMIDWTDKFSSLLMSRGAFYVWGGVGRKNFRPFMRYTSEVESKTDLEIANFITWKKKRGIGTQYNYLFTREELLYMVKGKFNKPRMFNVPYLDEKRSYAGFNKKYPAKSMNYRRSNVWTDINEIFSGKKHATQKTQRLHEVIIETHTVKDEYVFDPFAGYGTTAHAARKLGRKFIVVEYDKTNFDVMKKDLR